MIRSRLSSFLWSLRLATIVKSSNRFITATTITYSPVDCNQINPRRGIQTTRIVMNTPRYSDSYITEKLQKNFEPIHLDVVDVSDGCGAKFEVIIVSAQFDGKAMLQRHRLVNECLAEELKTIHAFSMRTLTPAQWEKIKQQQQ